MQKNKQFEFRESLTSFKKNLHKACLFDSQKPTLYEKMFHISWLIILPVIN